MADEKIEVKLEDTKEFQDLMLHTLPELKKMLDEEEVIGTEYINDKKAAVATILTLKKKKEERTETPKTTEVIAPDEKPNVTGSEMKGWSDKANKMKEICAAQPKVRTMIPFDIGEKPGAVAELQINGYKLTVMKGVYVPLPQSFADLVADSWQQTSQAGSDINLDRINPETGKRFGDAEALI